MVQGLSNNGYYVANGYGNGVEQQAQAEAQSNGSGGTVGATIGLLGSGAYMGFAHKYNISGRDLATFSDEKFNKFLGKIEDEDTKDDMTYLRQNIKSVPETVQDLTEGLDKDAEGYVNAEQYKRALDHNGFTLDEQIKAYSDQLEEIKDCNDDQSKVLKNHYKSEIADLNQKKTFIENAKDGKLKFDDITKLETKLGEAKEIRSAERTIKDLGKDAPKVKLFENFKDLGKLKKAGIVVGLATVAAGLIGKLFNSDKKEAPAQEQAAEVPAAQGQLAEVPQPQVPAQTPQAPAFAGAPVNQATLPIMPQQQFAAMQAAAPVSPLDAPIGNPYAMKPGFSVQA